MNSVLFRARPITVVLLFLTACAARGALDRIICVPWQGDPLKYHTALSGQAVRLKAVVRTTNADTIWYQWVFGDGTESPVTALSGTNTYNLEVDHVYTGTVGTPYTARLLVDDVDSSMANAQGDPYLLKIEEPGLDSRVNIAIDNGLWFLHKDRYFHNNLRSFNGLPVAVWRQTSYQNAYASPTASALHAYQINGHKQTGNPDEDPYVTHVRDGFNWLFSGYYQRDLYPMLRAVAIAPQHDDDPDVNGNGIGIEVRDYGSRPIYEGGMVMDAIVASGTPNEDSGRDFDGDGINDTYGEILQDMCDMYAWGQTENFNANIGGLLGSWRYSWNSGYDNSAAQWAAIGMIPAQAPPWNCVVPTWVKTYNNNWLTYSHRALGSGETGGFGYTGAGTGDATTPGGMVQLAFVGAGRDDIRWQRSERWFAENWKDTGRDWLDRNNIYGFYAFAKAMRLALPTPIETFESNGFNWYRGDATHMGLADKVANTLITSHAWTTGPWVNASLGTAWAVIILRPALFQEAPIACYIAQPNPTYSGTGIEFDPSCSDHSDPAKTINDLVLFEWDWDNDGTYDDATTSPEIQRRAFACDNVPCIYPVTLRVTDDIGNQASYRQDIRITDPPHPPVARLKGPYWLSLCELDGLRIDASDSFDPDEGLHESGCANCPEDTLTAWEWDLDGAPWSYPGPQGAVVNLEANWHQYFPVVGTYHIGVRVTDNTALAYPGSGQPNLTHEAFTQVHLYEEGPCELVLMPGCEEATLSWAATGAPRYSILMSAESANTGYKVIAETTETDVLLTDLPVGVPRWFRVVAVHSEEHATMSEAVELFADPELCRPIADAGGPYQGCAGSSIRLSGARSTARLGTLVAWEWDLDDDGEYDDASGVSVSHSWPTAGTYPIGIRVTATGATTLTDTASTTVEVTTCDCLEDLEARPKQDKIQLTWSHEADADGYHVYRSSSPWFEPSPATLIAANLQSEFATYLDSDLPLGVTYYYRVGKVIAGQETCLSAEIHASTLPRRGNAPPAANAGPDQSVAVGDTVQLDGSASFDPNGDPIQFRWELTSKPAGSAAVLSATDVATPTFVADQRGAYVIELIVTDGSLDSPVDSVTIATENSAPHADPGPDQQATVGTLVELDGRSSSDPDGDPLTYRWFITRKPTQSDAVLDDVDTAQPSFVIDAPGLYQVELVVNDGIVDSPPAALTITTINAPPHANAGPDVRVAVNTAVQLDGSASSDVDGDSLAYAWSLLRQPQGSSATLANASAAVATLSPDLPGEYEVQLIVSDGQLSSAADTLIVTADAGPVANAGEDVTTFVGVPVELDGTGSSDPEGDPLAFRWTLVDQPTNSTPVLDDPTSANPTLTPDRKGVYTLELVVNDLLSDSAPDQVTVTVLNSPPIARAGDDLQVDIGDLVALSATDSSDADGDPLTYAWTLVRRPTGSSTTLAAANTPTPTFTPDLPGEYEAQLVVNDGELDSVPDTVVVRTANRAPIADAGPGQSAFVGAVVTLNGQGSSDPDGDPITFGWSFSSVPTGSQAQLSQPTSATPTFTPDVPGNFVVELVVRDGQVSSAPDSVTIVAGASATVPNVVGLTEADARTAIQGSGLVVGTITLRSDPNVAAGIVLEQDPAGGARVTPGSPVDLVISRGADTQVPVVTVTANPTHAPVGAVVTLTIDVVDDGTITNLSLTVNDVDVALDDNHATFVAPAIGSYLARASATDAAGNTAVGETTFYAVDPGDVTPPTVAITAPADNAAVTSPTNIIGSAFDPDGQFAFYTVEIASAAEVDLGTLESDAFVEIGRGTTEVHDGVLASLDPTLLQNDAYVIRLTGWDQNGQGDRKAIIVNVSGDLKLGNFRLEFTDLMVPLAGMPIEIKRIYDSLDATRQGDFGYGWRLGLRDARIFETLRPGTVGPTMFPGSRVFINTPDGRRVGFTAYTRSDGGFLFPYLVEVAFRPDPGVRERLESAGYVQGQINAWYVGGMYYGGLASEPYDPSAYRLTMVDGTVYEYDQVDGLQKVTDLSGNRLEFTTDGIFHYAAGAADPDEEITFVRDAEGRITQILDPVGQPLKYIYDTAGDLRSFTDPATNVTQFSYHSQRAHYLETIIDPLGRPAVRTEYDENGRSVAVIDALGNRTTEIVDPDARIGTFTDANGNVTENYYDERGNIIKVIDPEGGTTLFEFDANNREIRRTDPLGGVVQREYDDRGNITRVTDPLGNSTTVAYNDLNKPVSITDAAGNTTTFDYDAAGGVVRAVNALGAEATFTRDAQGRVTSVTDFNGNTTTFTYDNGCACGKPGTVIHPDGTFQVTEYNHLGRPIREVDELGNETLHEYDSVGRLISTTDPMGNRTRYEYAGALRTQEIDPLGRVTHYLYDDANRNVAIIDPAGGRVQFEYDAGTNRTRVIDAVSNVTTYQYDSANRLIRMVDPKGNATSYAYDLAGNQTEVIDRNGRKRTFEYDAFHRRIREVWWDGDTAVRTLEFAYDGLGLMTQASDPAGILEFAFDPLKRLTQAVQRGVPGAPDFTLTYTHDAAGNVLSVSDDQGVQVASEYDSRGNLVRRAWDGSGISGASVTFQYDAAARRTNVVRFADAAGVQSVGQSRYTYNPSGVITDILHSQAGGTVLAEHRYQRDAAQQIVNRVLNTQSTDYSYEPTGQLTAANYSDGQPDEAFEYDANGNRTTGGTVVGPGNQVTSDATFTYSYDAEGNLTGRTHTASGASVEYEYDHRQRLVGIIEKAAGGTVTRTLAFTYDALNRRIAKSVNGTVTRYRYEQQNIWADTDAAGVPIARYLVGAGIDEMIARYWPARGVDWYLTDHLGTVHDLADAAGNIANHIQYGSFGEILSQSESAVGDRFLFTGREYEAGTGLYYFRARFYDPVMGRFLSQDTLGFDAGDFNLYRYVGNRPNMGTDPFGHVTLIERAMIVGAITGAILAPVYDVICKLSLGQGGDITVTRVLKKFVLGGLIGAAAGGLIAWAALELMVALVWAEGTAAYYAFRVALYFFSKTQVLLKPPSVIGLAGFGTKVFYLKNCDFLEVFAAI